MMGEIKKYDESSKMFTRGQPTSKETAEVLSLKAGEYWSEAHDCDLSITTCNLSGRLVTAAHRKFGAGNYRARHSNGIMAILRKEAEDAQN